MIRSTPAPLSVFFEPGPPPPPHPALTSHTVIRYMSAPPTITAHEEVVPRSGQSKPSIPRPRTPTPEPPAKVRFSDKLSRHSSVTSSRRSSPTPAPQNNSTSSRQPSETSSESDLTTIPSDSADESTPIEKPNGEPGKPGSGGYNLKKAVSLKNYKQVKDYVSELIENCGDIDTRHSYAHQKENAFDSVYKDAADKFPELQSFNNCWPVEDMLKTHLKNSSAKWRKASGVTKSTTKKRDKKKKSKSARSSSKAASIPALS